MGRSVVEGQRDSLELSLFKTEIAKQSSPKTHGESRITK